MSRGLYVLYGREPVPAKDVLEWARWFETADRLVARDEIFGIVVSTVFPSIYEEEKPLLFFETVVCHAKSGELLDDSRRYETWDEALRGHEIILMRIKAVALYARRKG